MDILCQAKSGMGKTAVFVLATLQQLEPTENHCYVLVMCHTRELAFQISKEYERFSKYMSAVKCAVFFGGMPIQKDEETLKTTNPHIVVGTPGRIMALIRNKKLNLKHLKHFILDECDKMLEALGKIPRDPCDHVPMFLTSNSASPTDMRRDVQEIFRNTPHGKQVMMFSATLSKEIRPVCKKFMQDVITNYPLLPIPLLPTLDQSSKQAAAAVTVELLGAVAAAAWAVILTQMWVMVAATATLQTIIVQHRIIEESRHRIIIVDRVKQKCVDENYNISMANSV